MGWGGLGGGGITKKLHKTIQKAMILAFSEKICCFGHCQGYTCTLFPFGFLYRELKSSGETRPRVGSILELDFRCWNLIIDTSI